MTDYIQKINQEFKKRLKRRNKQELKAVPSIFHSILDFDSETLELGLGTFGVNLKNFISRLDLTHPELPFIFDGLLCDDQDFSKECSELLSLAKFAHENKLTKIITSLGTTIAKESLSKSIFRKVDSPICNKMYARLLKSPEHREEIRLSKRMQNIDLHSTLEKGDDFWASLPDSFLKFLRFDTSYKNDLKEAEKKVLRYKELGCSSLAEEIEKSISSFKENIKDSHYGFHRITMTNIALILAKSLKFDYTSKEKSNNFGNTRIEAKITIGKNFFGRWIFDPEAIGINHCVSGHLKMPFFTTKAQSDFVYQPRVYPLHEFYNIASKDTKENISILESFPDADNKPIFDHFGIIVPSVSLPAPKNNLYSFLDHNGMTRSFEKKEDAEKSFDTILLKENYIPSVIVGEKDGKCYFLTYFKTGE